MFKKKKTNTTLIIGLIEIALYGIYLCFIGYNYKRYLNSDM